MEKHPPTSTNQMEHLGIDIPGWSLLVIPGCTPQVPRGQYVCSPSFSIAAVRNMHIEPRDSVDVSGGISWGDNGW